ncbi:MAG: phosphoribosyl-ATP pyrophosphohydrolase [Lachnospirales bacterium]
MKKERIYNKLVRDRVPEIMKRDGYIPLIRHLDDDEYLYALHEKLKEEMREYMASRSMEELADVVEVINAILLARGLNMEELEKLRQMKARTNGLFHDRVFLERVLAQEEAKEYEELLQEDPVISN